MTSPALSQEREEEKTPKRKREEDDEEEEEEEERSQTKVCKEGFRLLPHRLSSAGDGERR